MFETEVWIDAAEGVEEVLLGVVDEFVLERE